MYEETITGTAQVVDVHATLVVSDLGETCDKFANTFTVDLNISGGVPGYTINGEQDVNTALATAGIFTSSPITIPVAEIGTYSFTVTDASGCTSGMLISTNPYTCDCSITATITAATTTTTTK